MPHMFTITLLGRYPPTLECKSCGKCRRRLSLAQRFAHANVLPMLQHTEQKLPSRSIKQQLTCSHECRCLQHCQLLSCTLTQNKHAWMRLVSFSLFGHTVWFELPQIFLNLVSSKMNSDKSCWKLTYLDWFPKETLLVGDFLRADGICLPMSVPNVTQLPPCGIHEVPALNYRNVHQYAEIEMSSPRHGIRYCSRLFFTCSCLLPPRGKHTWDLRESHSIKQTHTHTHTRIYDAPFFQSPKLSERTAASMKNHAGFVEKILTSLNLSLLWLCK